jgi:hypothetical protein
VNRVFVTNNTQKYQMEFYYPDLDSTGWCNQMLSYRYDLDAWNPPRDVSNAISTVESPVWYYDTVSATWKNDPASRTNWICKI